MPWRSLIWSYFLYQLTMRTSVLVFYYNPISFWRLAPSSDLNNYNTICDTIHVKSTTANTYDQPRMRTEAKK
ncbi:hypothetical protein Y032_0083g1648 [Ancylostoma ceylanicum]|uniref:Uncharacterized protein n=1 Tax=Ancylostoma ceylanicum TaxID=53326 RepID=A0A016TQA6_9BILA|nr:hypothetical protein Y032_0083g1648 [Ancylostoma ceylanicum]